MKSVTEYEAKVVSCLEEFSEKGVDFHLGTWHFGVNAFKVIKRDHIEAFARDPEKNLLYSGVVCVEDGLMDPDAVSLRVEAYRA